MRMCCRSVSAPRVRCSPWSESAGFLGDFKTRTIQPLTETKTPNYPTAWLPTVRIAKAWLSLVTEKPFEP